MRQGKCQHRREHRLATGCLRLQLSVGRLLRRCDLFSFDVIGELQVGSQLLERVGERRVAEDEVDALLQSHAPLLLVGGCRAQRHEQLLQCVVVLV